MCIGVPMQVKRMAPGVAWCEGIEGCRQVDTLLVGDQPEGSWLLVFLGSAREVLDPSQAAVISQAILSVNRVMRGESADVEHLFADLVSSAPQLPEHLQHSKSPNKDDAGDH